ncbi:MAG: alpha/beta fold hydrolase [Nanoarchaeota archaeon]
MKAVIFHGWGATSKDNWFPWLKNELVKAGFEVYSPDMPNTQNPDQEEWLKEALKLPIDEGTILIGHSLGTVLIMRLLEKIRVKSAYLAAAFDEHLGIEELKNFFYRPFDYDKINKNTKKLVILNSDNDHYIPLNIAKNLQKNLDCGMIIFESMEHLSNGTGNRKFPELLEMIKNETDKKD